MFIIVIVVAVLLTALTCCHIQNMKAEIKEDIRICNKKLQLHILNDQESERLHNLVLVYYYKLYKKKFEGDHYTDDLIKRIIEILQNKKF